jgi:signal transduction histidine kinase
MAPESISGVEHSWETVEADAVGAPVDDCRIIGVVRAEIGREIGGRASAPKDGPGKSAAVSAEVVEALHKLLRQGERALLSILEAIGDPVRIISPDLTTVWSNAAFCEVYGDMVGSHCYREIRGLEGICPGCPACAVFQTGEKASAVSHSRTRAGRDLWAEITASALRDVDGNVVAAVEIIHDVTVRRKLEEELLQRNKELETISVITSALMNDLVDIEDAVSVALDQATEMLGVEAGMIRLLGDGTPGLKLTALKGLSEDYLVRLMQSDLGESGEGSPTLPQEVILTNDLGVDPTVPTISREEGFLSGARIPIGGKSGILGVMDVFSIECRRFSPSDVRLLGCIGSEIGVAVEEARLFSELSVKTEEAEIKAIQLQSLLARQYSVREEERKRIARDIHDGIGQMISGALVQLAALDHAISAGGDSSRCRTHLHLTQTLLKRAFDELGPTLFELSPRILDLGLVPALRKYLGLCQASFGIACHLKAGGEPFRLPPEVETTVYRIVQEALQNVRKHAKGSEASVCLEFGQSALRVSVQDNGNGYWSESNDDEVHLGLVTMRERVISVGGKLSIRNFPGYGTVLTLDVPKDLPSCDEQNETSPSSVSERSAEWPEDSHGLDTTSHRG